VLLEVAGDVLATDEHLPQPLDLHDRKPAYQRLGRAAADPELCTERLAVEQLRERVAHRKISSTLSNLLRVRDHAGEIVREDGLGIIVRLTSDPARLYGYSPTDVICDELAWWTTPNLKRAYAALTSGGGARSAPQVYTITTAGEAAQRHDSILGRILDAALESDDVEREAALTIAGCGRHGRWSGPTRRKPGTPTTRRR
jgi:hypothetical protein